MMNYRYGGKDVNLLRYLEERVEQNPGSSFFAMLSYFYLEVEKIPEALSIAQRGVIAHPNYSTGHAVLAMAMMKARLFYDARKELAKVSELNPGSKIVESLVAALDKQEQADEIGKKLAEQFSRNRPGGQDLMKTIRDTIESYRPKPSTEDFIIPGLDAIMGPAVSETNRPISTPTLVPPQSAVTSIGLSGESVSSGVSEGSEASMIAKAIIEKVAREMEAKSTRVSESEKAVERTDAPIESSDHVRISTVEPPATRNETSISAPERLDEREGFESELGETDLDALARELEAAGPIRPPVEKERDRGEESGIDLTPEIVTDTLAMIFEQQGQLKTAIEAYRVLIEKKPEQAEFYRNKIAELTKRTNG